MVDILADPVEICFDSFTMTSTTLAVATSPTASMKGPRDVWRRPQHWPKDEDPPAQTL
jgi:hypothetical protein